MTPQEAQNILSLPMGENDAGAATVRQYIIALALAVWTEGEGFSGKRPFGNSSWDTELYEPLITAGLIKGPLEDGLSMREERKARKLITEAIQLMATEAAP